MWDAYRIKVPALAACAPEGVTQTATGTGDSTIDVTISRVEVSNVIDVAWYRDPPFKADDRAARLADGADTLSWRPNFTAAANEDHKGYNGLIADAAAALRGEPSEAPTIRDGVAAMRALERMIGLLESS